MIVKYLRHLKSQHSMWTRNSIFIHVKIIFLGWRFHIRKKRGIKIMNATQTVKLPSNSTQGSMKILVTQYKHII